jgi:hypothetical protein
VKAIQAKLVEEKLPALETESQASQASLLAAADLVSILRIFVSAGKYFGQIFAIE